MLDHRAFVHDHDALIERLQSRGVEAEVLERIAASVRRRSEVIQRLEGLRHQLNQATEQMKVCAAQGDATAIEKERGRLKELKGEIKRSEEEQHSVEASLEEVLLLVPNLPDPSVPVGNDERDNRCERSVGDPPAFNFKPQPHWELGERLGILDFETASKISGSRFVILRGAGARLARALGTMMLDLAANRGFVEVQPPLLVRRESMQGAGQYPKFEGESFETLDHEYALIPTSEVPLVNLHRDQIVDADRLPLRYTALTPCFRREAGAAGKDTRGLIRQHQFDKVELVSFSEPESSAEELEKLTACAEDVLKSLELPFRVMTLCTGDMGFAAAKTYDLEVWLPGQDAYREISSCSNCHDFQARRAKIRYRPEGKKTKPRLLHTLNGSSVAVGRALVAVLENGQQPDGSVRLPAALVKYFGQEVLTVEDD